MGSLALLFFALHEAVFAYRGHPENGLWSCNVAVLAVGFGLLIPSPIINAVGAFWLTAGLPLWVYYLFTGDDVAATTFLSHLGGLAFAYTGMKRLGVPSGTWLVAVAALFGLILLSRPLNSPAENVNFSYGVYGGAEKIFPSYWIFIFAIGVSFAAVFAALQWALPKLGFPIEPRSGVRL
jgi:hypothetical protein